MTGAPNRSSQLGAVAELRWRMFVNGLRTRRGKMELASRVIVTLAFTLGGFGGFAAAVGFSWWFGSHDQLEYLPILLWPIFFFWQAFPVMATAFTNNPDSTELLRFPLTYRSFFLIRLAYGMFDPASALGCAALFGVFLGISYAQPLLAWCAFLVLITFALFNLLLMQMVFAWLERWLAQRRTREIMGICFILFMLSFQLIGPLTSHFGRHRSAQLRQSAQVVARVQATLPPGLAGDAIAQVSHAHIFVGFTSLLFLATVTAAIAYLLHLRLRQQFRGENLSEAAARPVTPLRTKPIELGWELTGLSSSVAAVFEKEMRYLARSGPMLLTLFMPIFMVVIFRLGPASSMRQSGFLHRAPDMAFPSAAAYSLLVLTNLVFNSFGAEGGGMQFFYAAPVTFRQIVLGKNLMHAAILLTNVALAWVAVAALYGTPSPAVSIATLAALLFAAPLNFTAGNLLSFYSPKKRDFSSFGRQNVSQMTVLISLGVQIVIVGIGGGVFLLARLYGNLWIAAAVFCVIAAISFAVYGYVLRLIDKIALERRDTMLSEVSRA